MLQDALPVVRTCVRWRGETLAAIIIVASSSAVDAATITVGAGGDLQGAINRARAGDTIVLAAGATYVGNFVLPVFEGAVEITIRTSSDSRQPGAGRRVTPAHAAVLAKLRSPNSLPAVQTAAGAHHWRLELLELQANGQGYGEIVRLGLGGSAQNELALVPHHVTIDRCYIHGDPALGQKRGIGLNSAATTIINSYIADIKGVGFDTQAIGGWNGPGPYVIENNYLEAAGENVMFGGADPMIANLTPSDITFRGNHVSKPREWRAPIIPAPNPAATAEPGAGSLPAGTYGYRVVARRPVGQGNVGGSPASVEVTVRLATAGAVRVTWPAVAGATEYRVYGRLPGAAGAYWTVTGTSFVDNGQAGTAGAVPADGSRWTVKNLFELKHARRVLVEGNVFENCWAHAQGGLAIVMTPRNPGGIAPWTVVADVTIRYNVIRHTGGGMSVNGYDTNQVSQQAHNIRIEHNLVYDVNERDGIGRFLIMGGGPRQVTFDHNTILQSGTVLLVHGRHDDGTYDAVEDFRFTNNLTLHNEWGIVGEAGGGLGTSSILTYFGAETAVRRNVLAGGPAARYPATNLFPTVDAFWAEFVDSAANDYRLRSTSPYRFAGTDGLDLGANIDRVRATEAAALAGIFRAPVDMTGPAAPRNLRVVSR